MTSESPFRSISRLLAAFSAAACWAGGAADARAEDSVEERVRALLAASHSGAAPAAGAAQRVRVAEGRAAVFATTNAAREALGWLPAGTELCVRGELPDESVWVCVEPPETVSVWIYRELVRDGKVDADKSRLRSGAGLNYRTVGSLAKGTRVEVRGKYGDWLRIKPPADMAFWMLRDQVEPLAVMPPDGAVPESEAPTEEASAGSPPDFPEPAETNRAPALAAPVPPVLPARVPPPELAGAALADVSGQGAPVSLTGVLDWGTVGGFAAPFCLVARQSNGDTLAVCHVIAPASLANPHVGERVAVEGTRWQVRGVAMPVLVVRSLRPQE